MLHDDTTGLTYGKVGSAQMHHLDVDIGKTESNNKCDSDVDKARDLLHRMGIIDKLRLAVGSVEVRYADKLGTPPAM